MLYFLMKGMTCKVEDYKIGTKSQQDEVFSFLYEERPLYLDLLFNGIDWLYKVHLKTGLDSFFDSVFRNSDSTDRTDKVFLFGDGNHELNLFRRFVSQPKSLFEGNHVLLFCIIKYGIQTGIVNPDQYFLEYVRNCRNYLESKSYFDHAALVMQPQVRVTDMSEYNDAFERYIAAPNSKSSIRKMIEDLPYIRGNTMSFDEIISKVENHQLEEDLVREAITSFNNLSTSEKVKLLLSNGFRGVWVGDCGYGKRIFLGSDTSRNKTRISHWDVVFRTKESQNIKEAINSFVCRYCNGESSLEQITKIDYPKDPIDYLLKYDDVLCAQVPWRSEDPNDAFFFFAMQNPWMDLDMISIHSYSGNPLAAAYQVCPMTKAVANKLSFVPLDSFHFVGHAAEKAGMTFIDKNERPVFSLVFGKMEWEITIGSDLLPQSLKDKYSINHNNQLFASEREDLIEIAVCFMEDVFKIIQEKNLL